MVYVIQVLDTCAGMYEYVHGNMIFKPIIYIVDIKRTPIIKNFKINFESLYHRT